MKRTRLLLHVLDIAGTEGRDPLDDYNKINAELKKYSDKLANRKQIIVANKIDALQDDENLKKNSTHFKTYYIGEKRLISLMRLS